MKIDQQIETATTQLSALIDALNGMIAELPDNPRIHRMNDKCFVVSKSNLGDNWTPEHHDFKWQYRAVIASIQRAKAVDAITTLRNIIAAGKVRYPDCQQYVTLHADVVANLKTLLSDAG